MSIRISQPSFQSLFIEMQANGNTIARGTSFVATSMTGTDFLLTNRHNVTGRNQETGELLCTKTAAVPDSLSVWHNSSKTLGEFIRVEVPLFNGETPRWIEHPGLQEKADFVAIPIDKRQDINLYPYRIGYHTHLYTEPAQIVASSVFRLASVQGHRLPSGQPVS